MIPSVHQLIWIPGMLAISALLAGLWAALDAGLELLICRHLRKQALRQFGHSSEN